MSKAVTRMQVVGDTIDVRMTRVFVGADRQTPGSGAIIDDTAPATDKVYSSAKVESLLDDLPAKGAAVADPDSASGADLQATITALLASLRASGAIAASDAPPANVGPAAAFTVSAVGLVVTCTDASTDSDGTIAERAWTFGDGGTSAAANPSHTYASPGSYDITLTVTDDDGATASVTHAVTVAEVEPLDNPFDAYYDSAFRLSPLSAAAIADTVDQPAHATTLDTPGFVDPAFGTRVYRATSIDDVPGGTVTHIRHDYSRRQAFNTDNTRFLALASDGYWHLYDATTFQRIRVLTDLAGDCEPLWHPTDPAKLYFTSNTGGLVWWIKDVEADTREVLFDFNGQTPWTAATSIWTKAEGCTSADGRYIGLMATSYDSGTQTVSCHGLLCFDLVALEVVGTLDASVFDNAMPDHVSMSPSGAFVVPSWAYNATLGTRAYARDFSTYRMLHTASEHSDLAFGPNGEDFYVFCDYTAGQITARNMADGTSFDLISLYPASGTSYAAHISGKAFDVPGWVVISTYSDAADYGETHPDPTLRPPYRKVFLAELVEGGRLLNVAHIRSTVDDYFGEPQASASRDLSRIIYASNLGSGPADSYVVGLPSWALEAPAPAAPVSVIAPAITGSLVVGATLTRVAGEWTGADSVAGEWWVDGVASGETGTTFTAVAGEIVYRETATNDIGSTTADSTAVTIEAGDPVTYATWDASSATEHAVLSAGNSRMSPTTQVACGVRAQGALSGKRYFEIAVDVTADVYPWLDLGAGIASDDHTFNESDPSTSAYMVLAGIPSRELSANGESLGTIGYDQGTATARYGIAVDADTRQVWVRHVAEAWETDPASGTDADYTVPGSAPLRAVAMGQASAADNGTSVFAELISDPASLVGTAPAGFTAGLEI